MKSQKGITLMSLLIYVVALFIVAGIVGAITQFFYNNYSYTSNVSSESAMYNKLDLAIVKELKELNDSNDVYLIKSSSDKEEEEADTNVEVTNKSNLENREAYLKKNKFDSYILFKNCDFLAFKFNEDESEKKLDNGIIYFNQTKLCENVKNFSVLLNYENGKGIISVCLELDKKTFTNKYTLNN